MKKKIIFISILLLILSISCTSATDNGVDTNITTTDTLITSDSEILSDSNTEGNFTSLASEIEATDAGETLELTKNYTYDSSYDEDYVSGITINKAITIDGKGYTLNGNNLARILYVNASKVIVKNIVFINAYTSNTAGSAIYWNGDNGTLINSSFSKNVAKIGSGGAIYWNGKSGKINDSTFDSNTAQTTGGAVQWNGDSAQINNCTFTKNSATMGGGALSSVGINIIITNSTFTSNSGNMLGGGGAVKFNNVNGSIINSKFKNNKMLFNSQGGAVFWNGDSSKIDNCSFESNSATSGTSVYTNSSLNISNSIFNDTEFAKTVYNNNNLYLYNNTLNNNNTIYINSGNLSSQITAVIADNGVINYTAYENKTISGTLYDDNNNPIILSNLNIILNDSITLSASFNQNGTFSTVLNTNNTKTYYVSLDSTIELSNLTTNIPSDVESTISSADMKRGYNSGIDFNATFYDRKGNVLANTTVQFKIGNTIYNATTDLNGVATLNEKLSSGSYIITSVNPETNEEVNNTLIIVNTIQSNSNVVMFYLDGSKYSVLIYGSTGNTLSGVSVTFKVNGKTYTRTTDSNGYATLKLNIKTLVPKTYTITATYNGYTVKNTVKVKQIIKAKKTTKVKKTAKKLKVKITLKGKTVLKKKNLKVKFKGKTYKLKTNKKGVAYFKLTKKVIKKLKKGKKYSYTIIYQKDKVKKYIKVKK